MTYGLAGEDMPEEYREDPYSAISDLYPRDIVKKAILIAINASNRHQSFNSFKKQLKKMINDEDDESRENLLDALNQFHTSNSREGLNNYYTLINTLIGKLPILDNYLDNGFGLDVMYWDSKIAENVIYNLTNQDIPCLCIHDSFIVPKSKENELRTAMIEAYSNINIPKGLPPIKKE